MNKKTARLIRKLAAAVGGDYRAMKKHHSSTPRSSRAHFRNATEALLESAKQTQKPRFTGPVSVSPVIVKPSTA